MSDQEVALFKADIKLQANIEVTQKQEVESYTQAASQSHTVRQAQQQISSQLELEQQEPSQPQSQVSSQAQSQVPFLTSITGINTTCTRSTRTDSNDKFTLDLRKARLIPVRCKSLINSILQDSGLQLVPKLMVSEYNVLTKLLACSNMTNLYDTVQEISFFAGHNELSFIKMAVTKICLLYHEELIDHSNNEDWYRVNVYGDTFDILFNMKHGYKAKRSECYSQTIKVLTTDGLVEIDEKDMRLDFIFTNSSGCQDLFFCADKTSAKLTEKDKVKADYLRENTL